MNRIIFLDLKYKSLSINLEPNLVYIPTTPYAYYVLKINKLKIMKLSTLFEGVDDHIEYEHWQNKLDIICDESKYHGIIYYQFLKLLTKCFHREVIKSFIKKSESEGKVFSVLSDSEEHYLDKLSIKVNEVIHTSSIDGCFYNSFRKAKLNNKLSNRIKKILDLENLYYYLSGRFITNKTLSFINYKLKQCIRSKNAISHSDIEEDQRLIYKEISGLLSSISDDVIITKWLKSEFALIEQALNKSKVISIKDFSTIFYIHDLNGYIDYFSLKLSGYPVVISQHGSYYDDNSSKLKHSEIKASDYSIVLNNKTKDYFEKQGANCVFNLGGFMFNYKNTTNDKQNKRYDFLYITYCTSYSDIIGRIEGNQLIESYNFDLILERHIESVKYFGESLPNKKVCFKIQLSLIESYNYLPLIEVAKDYENIDVEFFKPLDYLIEKSEFIITDYFSSNFINSDVLLNNKIIMFKKGIFDFDLNQINELNKVFNLIDDITEIENVLNKDLGYMSESKIEVIKYISDYKKSKNIILESINKIKETWNGN